MISKDFNLPLWGLDLGGTKIEICCFSLIDKNKKPLIHYRERVDTVREDGYEAILTRIRDLCVKAVSETKTKIDSIGIGHPGIIDCNVKVLKNSNTTCLNGMPLDKDLKCVLSTIGIQKVILENDANCFALAESLLGSGYGSTSSFGVILGTGVGGSMVLNNKIVSGISGIAGEWGHLSVWDEGPKCYCGKRGCIESIISGPALELLYLNLTGIKRPASDIARREKLEVAARITIERFKYWLGKGLSHVVNIFDPQCIILGGGLSNIESLYINEQKQLSRWVFDDNFATPVLKAELGDSAGVFGAGLLLESSI